MEHSMTWTSRSTKILLPLLMLLLPAGMGFAQATPSQQSIPDAPSAKKPASELPANPVPQASRPVPNEQQAQPAPPPASEVKTVPQGSATREPGSDRATRYTLT